MYTEKLIIVIVIVKSEWFSLRSFVWSKKYHSLHGTAYQALGADFVGDATCSEIGQIYTPECFVATRQKFALFHYLKKFIFMYIMLLYLLVNVQ